MCHVPQIKSGRESLPSPKERPLAGVWQSGLLRPTVNRESRCDTTGSASSNLVTLALFLCKSHRISRTNFIESQSTPSQVLNEGFRAVRCHISQVHNRARKSPRKRKPNIARTFMVFNTP